MGGLRPPSLVFCPLNTREGRLKDTVRNIEATGEYVVNLLTRKMAEAANEASRAFPPEIDEFDAAGFDKGGRGRARSSETARRQGEGGVDIPSFVQG